MKLYHGTNFDFERIDIAKSNPYKDFGQGFYLTDIFNQAAALANKKTRVFGGTPVIQTYEFDEAYLEIFLWYNTCHCIIKEEEIVW